AFIAAIGVSYSFVVTVVVVAVSGVGVAAFHPAGAGRARKISGGDHVIMSWFPLGGNIGFALAPLAVAASIGVFGLKASPLLLIPAVTGVLAVVMIGRVQSPADCAVNEARTAVGRDDWSSFEIGRAHV